MLGIEPESDVVGERCRGYLSSGRALLGSRYVVIWADRLRPKEKGKSLRAEATAGGVAFSEAQISTSNLSIKSQTPTNPWGNIVLAFIFICKCHELNSSVLVLKSEIVTCIQRLYSDDFPFFLTQTCLFVQWPLFCNTHNSLHWWHVVLYNHRLGQHSVHSHVFAQL